MAAKSKLYKTERLQELTGGLKTAKAIANYCFDEAWITHLHSEGLLEEYFSGKDETLASEIDKLLTEKSREDDDCAIAIACAATEIGERLNKCKTKNGESRLALLRDNEECFFGYATDDGFIQKKVYQQLFGDACLGVDCSKTYCDSYSKDTMTNFAYVFRLLIAILSDNAKLEKPCYWYRELETEEGDLSNIELFHNGYSKLYGNLIKKGTNTNLVKELGRFAHNSSTSGNYCCIPKRLEYEDGHQVSLNGPKGTGKPMYVASIKDYPGCASPYDNPESNYFCEFECWNSVNDQFALFAEWIENEKARGELKETEPSIIDTWKKAMLIDGVWDVYLAAAAKYKEIWKIIQEDESNPDVLRERRLKAFTEYLEYINVAIEARSLAIAKKLISTNEEGRQ